jgi:hypothetical protein
MRRVEGVMNGGGSRRVDGVMNGGGSRRERMLRLFGRFVDSILRGGYIVCLWFRDLKD